ncbi:MAG: hypothetical protein A3J66_01945 [Candidatus Magasanikbacteria bacterium RIFCSPHIGHO2_02_FULL_47_14]|uniref:DNA helicase UvrD n=1 Tax=Candidatus Magasanikbacteria bacterium RIFCSPHIGHO2_02_FULL_47_14 TaxID=1798680 RepID=A0A1F6MAH8_9BACT|nr:MAG: hypothetical protein A3J66_01945 [Candidatus Magasanikbacteria bacterium RIFCSPHIGHO2_02_FULL_47_14]
MRQILDLHTHSKYSRACSKELELPKIAATCAIRGIDIVATGDFTHPKWFAHLKEQLKESGDGIYQLNSKSSTSGSSTKFLIGTEVAVIKKHKDKVRRLHLLLFAPSLEVAEKCIQELQKRNINLNADGRPIIGMTAKDLLQLILEVDERMVMIPAHAWTPWFGVFGSKGGYDSLEDAFEELAPRIFAIETGLSSDPLMNWRCSWLDRICMVSCSDAHSPQKLGREANVFQFTDEKEISYDEIMRILRTQDRKKFLYTVEFYPEEGKYHYDGHRECKVSFHPRETKKHKGVCPVCKRPLVIGVMNRVEELADRTEDEARTTGTQRIPYKNLVPLPEILADTFHVGVGTKRVVEAYTDLITHCRSEFSLLLDTPLEKIEQYSSKQIAQAIGCVREGRIHIEPGYDGVFGVVRVFGDKEDHGGTKQLGMMLE